MHQPIATLKQNSNQFVVRKKSTEKGRRAVGHCL